MTRDETKRLLTEIDGFYPDTAAPKNPTQVVDLWTEVLQAETFAEMHNCLLRFVKTDTRGSF